MSALAQRSMPKFTANSNGTQLNGVALVISGSICLFFKMRVKMRMNNLDFFVLFSLTLVVVDSEDICLIYHCV